MRGRVVAAVCAALIGCASAPTEEDRAPGDGAVAVVGPTETRSTTRSTPRSAYEQQQLERALAFTRQKRLADTALAWELLTVLRPDVDDYRERLADTQRQIDVAVAERLPRAAQAAQRGDVDNATQLYLAILALQPLNEPAGEALRALERERNKRSFLGKYSRTTLTRRAMAEAEMPAGASAGAGSGVLAGRNELEHAALLAGDGEFDDAIGLLEHRLALDPKDSAARRLLADVYYRKADALLPGDRPGAIVALKKSARTDPSQTRAAKRLGQLGKEATVPAGKDATVPIGASASASASAPPAAARPVR